MPTDPPSRSNHRRSPPGFVKAATALLGLGVAYLLAEVVVSVGERLFHRSSYVLFERSPNDPVVFDGQTGYRYAKSGTFRSMRRVFGRVEYSATLHGNNMGFLDRHDHGPRRVDPAVPRIAVLGDSFTSGFCLDVNWPDRVEETFASRGRPVELIQCSLDGTGLANWYATLERLIFKEAFELDGVIFAPFEHNLLRRYMVSDSRGSDWVLSWRSKGWNPSGFPVQYGDVKDRLRPLFAQVVTPAEFDRAQAGTYWPLRAAIASEVWYTASLLGNVAYSPRELRDLHRLRMMHQIGEWLDERRLPAMVVLIPGDPKLVAPADGSYCGIEKYVSREILEDFERFAAFVNAPIVDGTEMFRGLSKEEVERLWLPVDTHWNQAGSDRFAAFLARELERTWLSPNRNGRLNLPPPQDPRLRLRNGDHRGHPGQRSLPHPRAR